MPMTRPTPIPSLRMTPLSDLSPYIVIVVVIVRPIRLGR